VSAFATPLDETGRVLMSTVLTPNTVPRIPPSAAVPPTIRRGRRLGLASRARSASRAPTAMPRSSGRRTASMSTRATVADRLSRMR